ncbi:LytTR family DNA-binding domain-containing protein [Pedobacter sp. MC2016-24]|uniref:LytTR family DNA-binding domain-containing protein n=1 Tax=Pedobacter sp. MC2016-24 TaxID=2780090 RepID=UPI00187F0DCC|nr:LytTR family DNA-binding domain-containing protein [Pedobacter sp. MC2016-24]MBE9598677.1 LytTR family transcriptional regulator DNA-binding domain-containing protein [Pedobacter sp. MC2016-24]
MVYVRYNDLWFRIIVPVLVAHFIVMYGEEISLFEAVLTQIYYVAMTGSILIAFLLISFVRWVYLKLDRKFDWRAKPLERAALQVLLGWVAPGLLAFLLAYVYFAIRGLRILKTYYLRFDYPIILVLLLLLNLYYLAYYFFAQMKIAERAVANTPVVTTESDDLPQQSFMVNQGVKSIPVPIVDIAYFFREGDYNFLRTFSGDDYTVIQPLDELEQLFPEKDFFRANRQMLVSRKACKHFENLPYNKLELVTEPKYKIPIVISQKKSRSFREWIDGNNSVK